MTYDFALKLADVAATKGHKGELYGFQGTQQAQSRTHQKHLKDYSTGEKYLTALLAKGVEICTCEACTVARGIQKTDAIEKVQWNAMHWYLAKVHKSDRVLQIGGE